jgi:hypothetical protein
MPLLEAGQRIPKTSAMKQLVVRGHGKAVVSAGARQARQRGAARARCGRQVTGAAAGSTGETAGGDVVHLKGATRRDSAAATERQRHSRASHMNAKM